MAATHQDTIDFEPTTPRVHVRTSDETKPSFKTTELIVLVATVVGVLVAATMDDSLNTLWTWVLVSALAIGYMLSRGLAKSGSQHQDTN